MLSPRFISSDDAIQKPLTLTAVPLQEPGADALAFALMIFYHMFGHLPCRNFAEIKNIMH